jgi:hypothetical protein
VLTSHVALHSLYFTVTILTSVYIFLFSYYQKDERAKSGNFRTNLYPPTWMCLALLPCSSLSSLFLSLSSLFVFAFKDRAMAEAFSRRPLTGKARIRSQASPCEIYGGQSGAGTGFSPSSSVFRCQYDSISSLSTCYFYWKDKRAKLFR